MPAFLAPEARAEVLHRLEARYAGMASGLTFRNPFELLVAVTLSAQSTDKMVNVVTGPLFERYPTAAAIAALTPAELVPWIAKIGLTNTKAKHVVEASRLLVERHGGEVPGDYDALVALPGVGRKTANVVLSNGFGVPAIPVDTHVYRVSNRLGLADHGNVDGTERQLMAHVPRERWAEAHHWLIWHGREVCKAPTPRCDGCDVAAWCLYARGEGKWAKASARAAERPVGKPAPKAATAKASGTKAAGTKATGTKATGTKAAGTKATGTKATGTKATGTKAAKPKAVPPTATQPKPTPAARPKAARPAPGRTP